jgi:hypothetical protein
MRLSQRCRECAARAVDVAANLRVQTLDGDDDVTVAPDVSDLIATIVDLGAGE